MQQSNQNPVTPYSAADQASDRKLLLGSIKAQHNLAVSGFEAISLAERFTLFFKEFNRSLDKRLAVMSKAVGPVDFSKAEKHIVNDKILFVRKGATEVLTPQGYRPGLGSLAEHVKNVNRTAFIIGGLKTEANRLYSWIKEIIKTGRLDNSFRWTVSDFDKALDEAENFLKNLPEQDRQKTYSLSQVYTSFEEAFGIMNGFNQAIKSVGGRDVEMVARELTAVYELGEVLVKKIESNDILLTNPQISDVESVINRFSRLADVAGAMMVLVNEMTAVFTSQVNTFEKL